MTTPNVIDFTEVDSGGFDPLSEDRYLVKCVDAELGTSKNNNPKIEAQFDVLQNIEGDEKYKNRKLWNNFTLVQAALFNLKDYLEAAGIDLSHKMTPEEIVQAMQGKTVSVWVSIDNGYNNMGQWKEVSSDDNALF